MRGLRLLGALSAAVLLVAGCGSDSADSSGAAGSGSGDASAEAVSGELQVFAAASLKESYEQLASDLKEANPDLAITFQYGASGQLATQIEQGAPADVFSSADEVSMTKLADAGLVEEPKVIAKNVLQIVVPAGNPATIETLADLQNPDLTIVTCAAAAACGKITASLEEQVGYKVASDSQEPDVKSVLQKVSLGEADAGLVYVTDVKSAGDKVEGIDIPEAAELSNSYPIAAVKGAPNAEAATAFIEYVESDAGQKILADHGFLAP
ncbi:molybdate ABC transporter substrate-binding protein [Epidermidibacterium keratini]|uniref:Molybdate ABC transporter substrate-binding protein n=1 Tax=Epidermidibacterium keratini TaxID=1891644 RepID=A0A7L4YQA0_9ACTN|nr:molybdate ABC transporter substrate-binding protein [Epidermidibacterium keratini]QHC00727.1 molybdate ABC transporter substrate-binding protein [Epidermidibacterium keratini]